MRASALLLFILFMAGCTTQAPRGDDLYAALGGKPGLERIASRFIVNIGESNDIRPYFLNSNLDRFHEKFVEHLCELVGGPCEYTGDGMEAVHIGMQVTEADFNYVVDLFVDAMEQESVPVPVQNRVLAKMAPLRGTIIYR